MGKGVKDFSFHSGITMFHLVQWGDSFFRGLHHQKKCRSPTVYFHYTPSFTKSELSKLSENKNTAIAVFFQVVVPPGIEPGTPGFSVLCSTN